MTLDSDPKIVGLGGAAAGASIATAAAGIVLPAVSLAFPIGGALVALAILAATGVLKRPEQVVYDPEKHPVPAE